MFCADDSSRSLARDHARHKVLCGARHIFRRKDTPINSVIVFGQLTRIAPDSRNDRVVFGDLTDLDTYSQTPPTFTLVAIASAQKLLACQVGDLVVVHGRIVRTLRGEVRVAVLDIMRLEIEGDQQQAQEATASA